MGIDYTEYGQRDVLKDVILTVFAFVGFFAYWLGLLVLIAFLMVHMWDVTFLQLCIYALIPTALTGGLYIAHLVKKRKREKEMRDYIHDNISTDEKNGDL